MADSVVMPNVPIDACPGSLSFYNEAGSDTVRVDDSGANRKLAMCRPTDQASDLREAAR